MTSGDDRLEPGTKADTDDGHCLHSMAISLKRIADRLDSLASGEGMEGLHHTISNMAWEAGRSFAAGQRTDR